VAPECASEKLAAATAKALTGSDGNGVPAGQLSKNARRHIRELEREIERAEEALAALETELALPGAWATPESSKESAARHAAAKREVEEAFARWEAASP
jgi:ATP-binding cassette subfamily F protein 3